MKWTLSGSNKEEAKTFILAAYRIKTVAFKRRVSKIAFLYGDEREIFFKVLKNKTTANSIPPNQSTTTNTPQHQHLSIPALTLYQHPPTSTPNNTHQHQHPTTLTNINTHQHPQTPSPQT
jgi:hypothetical protein